MVYIIWEMFSIKHFSLVFACFALLTFVVAFGFDFAQLHL